MSDRLPTFERVERVGVITLNDPDKLNALSTPAWKALTAICADIVGLGDRIGAVVLTGSGRGFCAGANLASSETATAAEAPAAEEVTRTMTEVVNPAVLGLRGLPVPLVTAVNGVAAGVGMSLALAGDVAIAARQASFVAPFMPRLGLVPDGGLSWLLPRLVGHARASAALLLGEKISAEQAACWGMVWQVVEGDQLMAAAMAVAARLAAGPPHAAREIRECLRLAEAHSFARQLHHEAVRQGQMVQTEAFRRGVQAFLAKKSARPGGGE